MLARGAATAAAAGEEEEEEGGRGRKRTGTSQGLAFEVICLLKKRRLGRKVESQSHPRAREGKIAFPSRLQSSLLPQPLSERVRKRARERERGGEKEKERARSNKIHTSALFPLDAVQLRYGTKVSA